MVRLCVPRSRGRFFSVKQDNKFQRPSLTNHTHLAALLGVTAQPFVALGETSGRAEPLPLRMTTPPNLSMSPSCWQPRV